MHHAPKSGMHHPSPEPSDVSVGGLVPIYKKLLGLPVLSVLAVEFSQPKNLRLYSFGRLQSVTCPQLYTLAR